jgi:hypothetical protein
VVLSVALWLDAELCGLLEREEDQSGVRGVPPLLPLEEECVLGESLNSPRPGKALSKPSISGVLLGSGTWLLGIPPFAVLYIWKTRSCGFSSILELLGLAFGRPSDRDSFHNGDRGGDCGLTTISGRLSALSSAGRIRGTISKDDSYRPLP